MECEDGTKWYNDVLGAWSVRMAPNGTMMCRGMECEDGTKWYNDVLGAWSVRMAPNGTMMCRGHGV